MNTRKKRQNNQRLFSGKTTKTFKTRNDDIMTIIEDPGKSDDDEETQNTQVFSSDDEELAELSFEEDTDDNVQATKVKNIDKLLVSKTKNKIKNKNKNIKAKKVS
jgi:hypothetical protein